MNYNIDEIMDTISTEILANLQAMSKSKSLEDKTKYSQIINSLAESHGTYLTFFSDLTSFGSPFDEDFDEFFDEEL